jgi:hypothetical protein
MLESKDFRNRFQCNYPLNTRVIRGQLTHLGNRLQKAPQTNDVRCRWRPFACCVPALVFTGHKWAPTCRCV